MEEIITPNEVAALLRIHVKTVYRLAEEGLIPGKRIGRSWRFRKSSVLELISNDDEMDKKVNRKKDQPAGSRMTSFDDGLDEKVGRKKDQHAGTKTTSFDSEMDKKVSGKKD